MIRRLLADRNRPQVARSYGNWRVWTHEPTKTRSVPAQARRIPVFHTPAVLPRARGAELARELALAGPGPAALVATLTDAEGRRAEGIFSASRNQAGRSALL